MSEPQQPFGDAEPRPSLAEQIAFVERLLHDTGIDDFGMDDRPVLRAVLDTLREVEAGEAGEPSDED